MKCRALHKKMIFFLDGELPAAEMEQIKNHLSECSECAAFAEEMKKTLEILASEKTPEVNPFFYTRLKAKMENQVRAQREVVKKPVLVKVLQPAFFTLLLLAGIYTGIKIGQPAGNTGSAYYQEQEMVPYLNEMATETIEVFLME